MSKKNQHVIPFGGGWAVKSEKSLRVAVITTKQSQAISYAREIAKKNGAELIIHGRDGRIRGKNNYARL